MGLKNHSLQPIIRLATLSDLLAITEIYNTAIQTTVATFDTEPKTLVEQREWFDSHNSKFPLMVAESYNNVLGWASLSRWSDRCAYSDTAEISVYVHKSAQGKGMGKQLMQSILDAGRQGGLHTVIARIVEGNAISIHLHEALGFEHIGIMKEVGKKFDRLLDVYMMQKIYSHA